MTANNASSNYKKTFQFQFLWFSRGKIHEILDKITIFPGQVAQSVEQRTENPRVGGSNPSLTTIFQNIKAFFFEKILKKRATFLF